MAILIFIATFNIQTSRHVVIKKIKQAIPAPIKFKIRAFKFKKIDVFKRKKLAKIMQKKHNELLANLSGKKKIRIVILAFAKYEWKLDLLYKKLKGSENLDPVIFIPPYTCKNSLLMKQTMEEMEEFLEDKKYCYISSYSKKTNSWVSLESLNPDLLFFTIPHNATKPEYYEDGYLNYLSCYFPYHHEGDTNAKDFLQYDQPFHNSMWKIFTSNEASYNDYKKTCQTKGKNVELVGYTFMEEYFEKLENNNFENPWKNKDSRKRIIWAPHHTILEDGRKKMSNFLEYAELFKELAIKYQDKIVWAFKPHPGLKEKLSSDKVWGIEKTNEYYNFWKNQEYTQLEEGYYIDLFYYSDAMIHDSGSFLNEYMYFRKPVLYLLSNKKKPYYNQFGLDALKACRIAFKFCEIQDFIKNLLNDDLKITEQHELYYKNNLMPYFETSKPSDKIIQIIENAFRKEFGNRE